MALYPRGEIFWCRWRIGGEEVRESTGTSDPKEAQEYHDRRRADLWRAQRLGERRVDWDQAALAWVEEHAKHKRSYASDLLKLRWLQPRLTGLALTEITTELLAEIRDDKIDEGWKNATGNRHLSTVSAILHFAAKRGSIVAAPYIPYLEEGEGRFLWIQEEIADKLEAELPEHLSRMARLVLSVGFRRHNVTHLTWPCVDLGRRVAWVWPDEAKAGKALTVSLNDDAIEVLQLQLGQHKDWVFPYRGAPVTHTKTAAWDAACARAGCPPGFRFHDLRHTWATWHVMRKTPLEVLMKLGGWASLEMVLRYAHFAPGYLAEYSGNVRRTHKIGHSELPAPETGANSLIVGVAEGIRTLDNWNHKPPPRAIPNNVIVLHQEVTDELRRKSRLKKS